MHQSNGVHLRLCCLCGCSAAECTCVITRAVGSGTFARVYEAVVSSKQAAHHPGHSHSQEKVALKLLDPERCGLRLPVTAQLRELAALPPMPHVMRPLLRAAGLVHGRVVLLSVQPLASMSLEELLRAAARAQTPLPMSVVWYITAAVCEAVAALHAHGLVHRDVTCANVLLMPDGNVLVGDMSTLIHAWHAPAHTVAQTIQSPRGKRAMSPTSSSSSTTASPRRKAVRTTSPARYTRAEQSVPGTASRVFSPRSLKQTQCRMEPAVQDITPPRRTPGVTTLSARAPEATAATRDLDDNDTAIDMWAVGCLVARLCAGHPCIPAYADVAGNMGHRLAAHLLCASPQGCWRNAVVRRFTHTLGSVREATAQRYSSLFADQIHDVLTQLLVLRPAARASAAATLTKIRTCHPATRDRVAQVELRQLLTKASAEMPATVSVRRRRTGVSWLCRRPESDASQLQALRFAFVQLPDLSAVSGVHWCLGSNVPATCRDSHMLFELVPRCSTQTCTAAAAHAHHPSRRCAAFALACHALPATTSHRAATAVLHFMWLYDRWTHQCCHPVSGALLFAMLSVACSRAGVVCDPAPSAGTVLQVLVVCGDSGSPATVLDVLLLHSPLDHARSTDLLTALACAAVVHDCTPTPLPPRDLVTLMRMRDRVLLTRLHGVLTALQSYAAEPKSFHGFDSTTPLAQAPLVHQAELQVVKTGGGFVKCD